MRCQFNLLNKQSELMHPQHNKEFSSVENFVGLNLSMAIYIFLSLLIVTLIVRKAQSFLVNRCHYHTSTYFSLYES